jgi:hypothetical protein
MDEAGLDDLRNELAVLRAREKRLSAKRDRLHSQIDLGFESETTRASEREVSAARRDLHRRIDLLRKILDARLVD